MFLLDVSVNFLTGFGEKQVASAFWNGEMESKLREIGVLEFFGKLKTDNDREDVMNEIDKIRAKSVYEHPPEDCSDVCKQRGKMYNISRPFDSLCELLTKKLSVSAKDRTSTY